MSEYMHLIGAEEVQRAGYNMVSAAEQMMRAATIFEEASNRLIQKMEEVASRIDSLAAKETK